jgi:hypothetical protein
MLRRGAKTAGKGERGHIFILDNAQRAQSPQLAAALTQLSQFAFDFS